MLSSLIIVHNDLLKTANDQLQQYDKDIQDRFSTIEPCIDIDPPLFLDAKPTIYSDNTSEKIMEIKEDQIIKWKKGVNKVAKGLSPALEIIKDEKELPSDPQAFNFYLLKKQDNWVVYFVNEDQELRSTQAKEIPGLCDLLPNASRVKFDEAESRDIINKLSMFIMDLSSRKNKYEVLIDKMARTLLNAFSLYLKENPVDVIKLFIVASYASDYLNLALSPEEAKENKSLIFFNKISLNLSQYSPGLTNPACLNKHLHDDPKYYDVISTIRPLIENILLPSIVKERPKTSRKKCPMEECKNIEKEMEVLIGATTSKLKENQFEREKLEKRVAISHRHSAAKTRITIVFASLTDAKHIEESLLKYIDLLLELKKSAEIAKKDYYPILKETPEWQKVLHDFEKKLQDLENLLSQYNHNLSLIKQDMAEYELILEKIKKEMAPSDLENEMKALEKSKTDLNEQARQEQKEYDKLIDQAADSKLIKTADYQLDKTIEKLSVVKRKITLFQNREERETKDHQTIVDQWVIKHFASLVKLYDRHMEDKSKNLNDPKIQAIATLCNVMVKGNPKDKASRKPQLDCDIDHLSAAIQKASEWVPKPIYYPPLVRFASNSIVEFVEQHHPTRCFIENLQESFAQMRERLHSVAKVDPTLRQTM